MPSAKYVSPTGVVTPFPVTPHHHDSAYARVDHTHPTEDTGVITLPLLSDWFPYGRGGFGIPSYRKHLGVVYLEGLAERTASVPANFQPLAVLPVGFRPLDVHIFSTANPAVVSSQYAHAQRVDVYPDGNVYPQYYNDTDGSTWLSLNGIAFFAEQ